MKRKGTLSIDGGESVVALSEDGVSQLDTNGWMWIGEGNVEVLIGDGG